MSLKSFPPLQRSPSRRAIIITKPVSELSTRQSEALLIKAVKISVGTEKAKSLSQSGYSTSHPSLETSPQLIPDSPVSPWIWRRKTVFHALAHCVRQTISICGCLSDFVMRCPDFHNTVGMKAPALFEYYFGNNRNQCAISRYIVFDAGLFVV